MFMPFVALTRRTSNIRTQTTFAFADGSKAMLDDWTDRFDIAVYSLDDEPVTIFRQFPTRKLAIQWLEQLVSY
jgi:hypothetical protein